jgi:hypothetical protein
MKTDDGMQHGSRDYFSYLLRLWKSDENGQAVWRVSLEGTQYQRQVCFTSLEAMATHLKEQITREPPSLSDSDPQESTHKA